ncbi:hypothetical protein EK904_001021 [Melospiza melodia maxima]|nr:hypothetical protein EK904_001021 [Melospiza melodia maxima]
MVWVQVFLIGAGERLLSPASEASPRELWQSLLLPSHPATSWKLRELKGAHSCCEGAEFLRWRQSMQCRSVKMR